MARNIDPKPEVEEKCNEMSDLENKCFTAKDYFIQVLHMQIKQ
jgi:hypothetical protein